MDFFDLPAHAEVGGRQVEQDRSLPSIGLGLTLATQFPACARYWTACSNCWFRPPQARGNRRCAHRGRWVIPIRAVQN